MIRLEPGMLVKRLYPVRKNDTITKGKIYLVVDVTYRSKFSIVFKITDDKGRIRLSMMYDNPELWEIVPHQFTPDAEYEGLYD